MGSHWFIVLLYIQRQTLDILFKFCLTIKRIFGNKTIKVGVVTQISKDEKTFGTNTNIIAITNKGCCNSYVVKVVVPDWNIWEGHIANIRILNIAELASLADYLAEKSK